MTLTIAISNQKGGVAKTTSCVSLGACLAETGSRVLIIDLDPQANLTMAVGFEPEELDCTIVDVLDPQQQDGDLASALQATPMEGLYVLPTDQRLVELEMNGREHPGYENFLRDTLAALPQPFDYILIDCPPSLGALTIMALTAADLALIPTQCDYFATRGLMNLLEIVSAGRNHTNPHLQYALFVSMFDARPSISRRILEQLRENFGNDLLETVISTDTRLRESVMANEPVITYASRTRASGQYRELAAELAQRFNG